MHIVSWSLLALLPTDLEAQCFGTVQFPAGAITPDATGVPTTISPTSFAGDYALVNLTAGHVYRFTSNSATDYITVSTAVASGAVANGTQPVLFTAPGTAQYFVHFHVNAACATEEIDRVTRVTRVYCSAGSNNCGGANESITRVAIGGIDNSSSCGTNGYSDFSDQVTGIVTGGALPITVTNLNGFPGDQVRVFVDWNRDFDLVDAGEEFTLSTTNNLTFTGTFTAPLGTTPGAVRMRVRLTFTGSVLPCGTTSFGEVEDYTLNVLTIDDGVFLGGSGRGDAQLAFPNTTGLAQYLGGSGRGDVQLAFPHATGLPQYLGGSGRGDVQLAFNNTTGLVQFLGGNGRGDVMLSFTVTLPAQVFVSLKGILEGPYSSTTGLMSDDLRALPTFPLTEPYTALGYTHIGGGGEETVAPTVLAVTGNNAIVDWVVVELRDAFVPTTVLATRSALVQRDGDVVSVDGTSPVSFNAPAGTYNVALRHRNHLGVMENNGYALSSTTTLVDLAAAATPTFGTNARKSIAGAFPTEALWAGDVTFNGSVQYTGAGNDRDPILVNIGGSVPTNVVSNTYSTSDVNLNGNVQYTGADNDRDPILLNIGGSVPTNVRVEQLP